MSDAGRAALAGRLVAAMCPALAHELRSAIERYSAVADVRAAMTKLTIDDAELVAFASGLRRAETSGRFSPSTAGPAEDGAVTDLLTAADVARLFGVTERTVRNWRSSGHLSAVQVGRTVRYRPDEVARVLLGQETAA